MIKRNELDSWYANKYPEFELSSNSVINNMQYKSSINKSIGKNWLNYCTSLLRRSIAHKRKKAVSLVMKRLIPP